MKKLLINIFFIVLCFCTFAFADPSTEDDLKKTEKIIQPTSQCPAYPTMRSEFTCFECHLPASHRLIAGR